MIYGFIEDSALLRRPATSMTQWHLLDQGCGFLTEQVDNYLVDKVFSLDNRASRLTVMAAMAEGEIRANVDSTKVNQADLPPYLLLDSVLEKWLNIIEYLTLVDGQTHQEMNDHLEADGVAYGAYIPDSLDVASQTTTVTVRVVGGTEATEVVDWVEFGMTIDGMDLHFHFWLNQNAFLADYPHSTITKLIHPCNPDKYLSMDDYGNVVDAVSRSAIFSNNEADPDVISNDHSGMFPFETRYHNPGYQTDYNFSFGLLYKGRRPTVMDAIVYTRNVILALGEDEATWRVTFPDLFIDGAFYMVPMWDNKVTLPTKDVYTSIGSWSKLKEKMQLVFPTYDNTLMTSRLEVVTTSAIELLIASLPDGANDGAVMSLNDKFSLYLAVDATTTAWNDQTPEDKHFNERLSDVIGVALGGANVNNIPTELYAGHEWLTFVASYLKIYVLKPANYPA